MCSFALLALSAMDYKRWSVQESCFLPRFHNVNSRVFRSLDCRRKKTSLKKLVIMAFPVKLS